MNRFITLLVAGLLLSSAHLTAQSVTFTVGNATGSQGQQVCLPIRVSNFNQVAGLQFSLSYDPSVLQYVSVQNLGLPGLQSNDSNFGFPGAGNVPLGRMSVLWLDNTFAGVSLADGSIIFEVCFNVISNSVASTMVSFSNTPTAQDIFNAAGNSLTFNAQSGTVTIPGGGGGGGGGNTPFRISIADASVQQGQQFCLNVSVEGFTNIASMQFSLQFDPTRLQFSSVGGFNLTDLNEQAFGLPGMGAVPSNRITFSWFKQEGVTVPNNTNIFQLCFVALANNTTTNVNFVNTPIVSEVINSAQQEVTFNSKNSTVTIGTPGSGGGGQPNSDTFRLMISDTTAAAGAQICLRVGVEGFNNILSMQSSIQFDPARLQFSSITGFNLSGLSINSFGTPGSGGVPNNRITFSWEDPAAQGLTIPDGTTIFQICFTIATGTTGATTVSFGNSPLTSEVINGNLQEVPFDSKNGVVTVGTGNGGGGGGGGGDDDVVPDDGTFRIWATNRTVPSGQQVCVEIRANRFTDIIGMQFTLQYNPAHLQFVSVGTFNLPGLSAGQFGTPTSSPPTTPGIVTVVWFDENVAGVTRPNAAPLFQVCFNAIAPNGTTTMINFTNSPTALEISNVSGQAIPANTRAGTITIGQQALNVGENPNITNVNCFGQSTGAIDIQVTGGSGNFTYQWSNGATTQDLTNIPAGQYSVTVTDTGSGQSVTRSYSVSQPSSAVTITNVAVTNVECGTTNTGRIVLSVDGGTPPYQFNWGGSLPNNVTTQNNLPVGQYSVTVTDARGCTLPSGPINVVLNANVQITSIVPTNIDAGNDGAVNITLSAPGTYTYSWRGPNNFMSSQQNLTGLSVEGEYCVTVTDSQGCSVNACATVRLRLRISTSASQVNRACPGTATGGVILSVQGGQPGYTYQWSNGATTQNLANVPAGNYRVTVTDSQSATVVGDFQVSEFPQIVLNANLQEPAEGVNDGGINLNITGGTPAYTVAWSTGATTTNITNLGPGEYCVTVTDSRGCTRTGCYTLQVQAIPLAFSNVQTTSVTCNGGNNGALSFQIQGGRPPYTIVFSNGMTMTSETGQVTRNGLSGGALSFTITDARGTTTSGTAQIGQPAPLQITRTIVNHDSEEPGCTGRITIEVTGGTTPYTVQWNAPNTGVGLQIINLCEGLFVPTIRDANGCTQTLPGVEVNTFGVSGEIKNAECPQDANGGVALNVRGGSEPYNYTWFNAAGEQVAVVKDLSNAAPGAYSVRVSESSGNTLVRQFNVASTSNLDADIEVISDYNGFDISCPNSSDGIIEAVGRNSDGNYTYQWRRNNNVVATTPVITGAAAGMYSVVITDGFGCQVTKQIEVVPPTPIEVIANIREVSCIGNRDGEIIVSALGGAVGRPYSFIWGDNVQGPRLSFLAPGAYTVITTDANNCTVTRSFTLEEPKPIQVRVETQPATDGCNGSAIAIIQGGTAPYSFQWNSFPNSTSPVLSNLCPGPYFVRVTDARGCRSIPDMVSGLVEDRRFPCVDVRTVITPDGDGLNEEFIINCINELNNNKLEIYNRWGQLVFRADNYDNSWRGTAQDGTRLPEGPYYFVLEYQDIDGNLVQRKGSLTILRER